MDRAGQVHGRCAAVTASGAAGVPTGAANCGRVRLSVSVRAAAPCVGQAARSAGATGRSPTPAIATDLGGRGSRCACHCGRLGGGRRAGGGTARPTLRADTARWAACAAGRGTRGSRQAPVAVADIPLTAPPGPTGANERGGLPLPPRAVAVAVAAPVLLLADAVAVGLPPRPRRSGRCARHCRRSPPPWPSPPARLP